MKPLVPAHSAPTQRIREGANDDADAIVQPRACRVNEFNARKSITMYHGNGALEVQRETWILYAERW